MRNEVRVGIAGLGEFGELHLRVFSQIPSVKVTRICSRSETRARELAARYGVPGISTDYAEFAAAEDVDVVSVTTLGKDHRQVVVPALERGKHVLVEKPIADTTEDAEAMAEAAAGAKGILAVGHICRFMPEYFQAWRAIASGRLGDIAMIQAWRNNHHSTLAPGRKLNPMRETAIHDIDLALWFTGSPVVSAHGYKRRAQQLAEADSCLAVARLACGTICSFASSWLGRDAAPAGLDARMKIIGTRGEIEIALPSRSYTAIDDSTHRFTELAGAADPLLLIQSPLRAEIECFLQRVMGNSEAPIVTAQEALAALRTAILLDESCEAVP